jgi:c-di-GMP-binding flagellar brake protein YcgR
MPELIRSVVSRMRSYVKDRRRAPRVRARLLFSVSVRQKVKANGSAPRERILKGHTRDISASGLALLLPQVHLDGHHLAAEGRELHLNLELPGEPISMVVMPARYEYLDESELGCSYFIGVRIAVISDDDRSRMESFIMHTLSGNVGRGLSIT